MMGFQNFDGARDVCLDKLPRKDCLVYSFGVSNDWDFEDIMDGLNCSVHAFDPSISAPSLRGRDTHFSKVGVGAEASSDPSWPLATLHQLLRTRGHLQRRIDYLKVDIEGEELATLPEWLDSGVLEHVEQLGLELHLPSVHLQEPWHWLLELVPGAWAPLHPLLRFLSPVQHHRMSWRRLLGVLQRLYRLGFRVIAHVANANVKNAQGGYFSYFDVVLMKE